MMSQYLGRCYGVNKEEGNRVSVLRFERQKRIFETLSNILTDFKTYSIITGSSLKQLKALPYMFS